MEMRELITCVLLWGSKEEELHEEARARASRDSGGTVLSPLEGIW